MHSCYPATKPCPLCSAQTSMCNGHLQICTLHKHAQQTIEQNWWKNRGVALLCALLSPHSHQHPPSHQCLDFHTLWVISHTHNMQVSTPLFIFLHIQRSFTHWQNVSTLYGPPGWNLPAQPPSHLELCKVTNLTPCHFTSSIKHSTQIQTSNSKKNILHPFNENPLHNQPNAMRDCT